MHAVRLQAVRQLVHRVAFGYRRQVELDPARLQRLARGSVHSQPQAILARHDGADRTVVRRIKTGFVVAAARAKAPAVDQGAGAGIVGAAALVGHLQRVAEDLTKGRREQTPRTCRRAVEAAQVRVAFPVAHLRDDRIELALQLCRKRGAIRHLRAGREHRACTP